MRTFLFLENWPFNHKLRPPLSATNKLRLKDSPHNLTKYEFMEGNFKISIPILFSELRKMEKLNELGKNVFSWQKTPLF